MKRHLVPFAVLFFWLVSEFGFPAVAGTATLPVSAGDAASRGSIPVHVSALSRSPSSPDVNTDADNLRGEMLAPVQATTTASSPDRDYDGLTDDVEANGWWNTQGFFTTDPFDPDSDDDGLTDGAEKLYDRNPLDDHSPGIYVEYEDSLRTSQYSSKDLSRPWGWQRYGDRLVSFGAVVVRRSSTFSVGGPADATIQITKTIESLTTLTPMKDACTGRWRVSVPSNGTVGSYQIILRDGDWSRRLNLYVIFELPTPTAHLTEQMIKTFLYDGDPDNRRDESGLLLGDWKYTHDDYPDRIMADAWINAGTLYRFQLQQFEPFVFEEHVIGAINGRTGQWDAAQDLVAVQLSPGALYIVARPPSGCG